MILITKLLLSIGGCGLSKLHVAVGILILLSLSGICAVGLYIVYPLSTGNDRGTPRNDSEQTFPTSTETVRNRNAHSKGKNLINNTQYHVWYEHDFN